MSNVVDIILSSDLVQNPWPVIIGSTLVEGRKHCFQPKCLHCEYKFCFDSSSGLGVCKFGVKFLSFEVSNERIIFPAYASKKAKKSVIKSPDLHRVGDWVDEIRGLVDSINDHISAKESDILHSFHDAFKWASQVNQMAEKLILSQEGVSFKEKLDQCGNEVKSIYKCSGLLLQAANATEIYLNPESASYGDKRPVKIYQLFDKVQAILFHGQGKYEGKRFRLIGRSYKSPYLYESFPVVALCLLQNAVKYSLSEEVEIFVDDVDDGVEVRVVSIGPLIDIKEQSIIFDKGVRGQYASSISSDGMGVGLYVAQAVARTNGFEIGVNSKYLSYDKDNIPVAQNTFYFTAPS